MTLGENLQNLRKEAGLSQEQVAQTLFVTRQTISKWENDQAEPGVKDLKALARLYGVTVDELLEGTVHRRAPDESTREQADGYPVVLTARFMMTVAAAQHNDWSIPLADLAAFSALLVGIFVPHRAVWIVIECLLGISVLFNVFDLIGGDGLIAVFDLCVSFVCFFVMDMESIRQRFQVKRGLF